MSLIGTIESIMRTANYLEMSTKVSTNKESRINRERTVSRREVAKDYDRRTQQGRNEPCNCGSGKKFKKCCGRVINKEE